MDPAKVKASVDRLWRDSITGALTAYIRFPNKSPLFDPDWARHGYMNDGVTLTRPAVSEQRFSLTPNGNVRYQLKTPYRDGTTHVIFEPLDFIAG